MLTIIQTKERRLALQEKKFKDKIIGTIKKQYLKDYKLKLFGQAKEKYKLKTAIKDFIVL